MTGKLFLLSIVMLTPVAFAAGVFVDKPASSAHSMNVADVPDSCAKAKKVNWYELNDSTGDVGLSCLYAREGNLEFWKGNIDVGRTVLPVLYTRSSDKVHGVLIWLHGGPNEDAVVAPGPEDLFLTSSGWLIVKPQYLGSRSRSPFSRNGFEGSISEISGLVDHLRQQEPERPVAVGGESYGGYLAAAVAMRRELSCLYLVDPMIDSYEASAKRSIERDAKGTGKAHQLYMPFRDIQIMSASYFGEYSRYGLLYWIERMNRRTRLITIMHRDDPVIGASARTRAVRFIKERLPRSQILITPGEWHGVKELPYSALSGIRKLTASCHSAD